MVLLKTPPASRGNSPSRKGSSPQEGLGASPEVPKGKQIQKRGRGSRGSSPGDQSTGSRGSSPGKSPVFKGKSKTTLPRSQGSETGSIERLEAGDKRVIATHQLLPEDNINVVVRVRPLSNREIKSGDESGVQFPGNGQIHCDGIPNSGDKKPKLFSYNVVFEPAASQEDILQYSGVKKLIEMAVEGFSCTAFCYGQTGSGKTHTLTGPPGLFNGKNPYSEGHGLVFRSFVYLFKILQERQDCNFVLRASFLEIYNEKVIDLLNPGTSRKPLAVRWSKKIRGFFVENLFTVECEELDDLLAVLEEGMRNRSVGSHNMNDHSSRSHTILTVHITSEQQMENGVFISKQGKINFVDLAGSEMTKKTQSEGKTLEEANNINKSLMVLGYCIASLSDGKKKAGHIPYRDSKLTKLLADSLAGNGVSLMIACISPARSNASETINTLRYAARAKKIRTKPIIVMDPREALILSLKREVGALQTENDHLRVALNLGGESPIFARVESKAGERRPLPTPPRVDLDKLAELEGPELGQLVRDYITENEALRRENAELYVTREQVMRDQEQVCRENERLLKKLEDVNSVCCRSPIIPARPNYSAELSSSVNGDYVPGAANVWTNPNSDPNQATFTTSKDNTGGEVTSGGSVRGMPEKVLKELDKRRIGGSFNNILEAYKDKSHHRRNNSWDNGNVANSPDQTSSPVDPSHNRKGATLRRTSTVPEERSLAMSNFDDNHPPLKSHSLNDDTSTPDSVLSGPILEASRTSSPFTSPEFDDGIETLNVSSRGSRPRQEIPGSAGTKVANGLPAHRVFGSLVSLDGDDPHFLSTSLTNKH
ncbi:kinesin-like protein KIF12 isoform X2 [Neodiprion fabricii]|uniref:kinesin-like protein KIF12 isoform X2 n=1 Tax=Neodiprion fabricii TaxID=2872261 RepID=UPI001ED96562|nr:kinesin-like protein KIF12 isoform X2 [Neodiprion fabricii]